MIGVFIMLSIISITVIVSIGWGYFLLNATNKAIHYFNEDVHLKREIRLERYEVRDAVKLINSEREKAYQNVLKTLKDRTYRAYKVAMNIYNKYKGKESKESIRERIKDSLMFQVFDNGKSYYFITSLNGVEILSPQKSLIGKNLLKDKRYSKSVQQEIDVIKRQKEGYVKGKFMHNGKPLLRIAFVKLFEPYGWYIGSGKMITNLEKETKELTLKKLNTSFGNFKNPSLFIMELSFKGECAGRVIFYTDPAFEGHTCLKLNDKSITYTNSKPCLKDCLEKLLKLGDLTTTLIWPYHKNKQLRERITYLYYYKPYNWIIGSCAPRNFTAVFPDFEAIIKKEAKSSIKSLLFIFFISALAIGYLLWLLIFLRFIYKPIKKDIETILNFFSNQGLDTKIDPGSIKVKELSQMAQSINETAQKLHQAQKKTEELLKNYSLLLKHMPECVVVLKKVGGELTVEDVNDAAMNCKAITKSENLIGKKAQEVLKTYNTLKDAIELVMDRGFNLHTTVKLNEDENDVFVEVVSYSPEKNRSVCIFRNITQMVCLYRAIEKHKHQLQQFIDKIKTGIIVMDKNGNIKYYNHLAKKLLCFEENEEFTIQRLKIPESLKIRFLKVVKGREDCDGCETNIITADGKSRWFDVHVAKIKIDSEPVLIISFNDITQRYLKNKQLEYLSLHDTLTGLYNRHFFEEEIKRLFNRRHYPLALVIIDLNGLKIANDLLGHEIGDKLIMKMAEILSTSTRGSDIAARIGGDEFAVIMPNTNENGVRAFIERIKARIASNNEVSEIIISASIGYAIQNGQFRKADDLMREADKNMYMDKYSPSRTRKLKEIIKWAKNLKSTMSHIDEDYLINR